MGIGISIFNLPETIAEISFKKIYLQESTDGFLMRLFGELSPKTGAKYGIEILDLNAAITLMAPTNQFVCEARTINAGSIWNSGHGDGQVYLQAVLSGATIEAIEAARKGGELQLMFSMRGLVTQRDAAQYSPAGTKMFHSNQEHVAFARSDWENALEGCGYGKLIRFALSIPKAQYSADVMDAYRHLDKGQKLLRQGHYRETIESCRVALNALRNGDGTKDKELFEKAAGQGKKLSEPERVALIRAATLALSQSGPHPGEVPDEMPPSYEKAAAMLYLTGLTAWLEEQKRESAAKA